jgi:hypothetical protein
MNQTLRRIAVSGAAAVALVGGAATITTAEAAEHQATVAAIADVKTDTQPGITNGLTPNGGVGAPLQNPTQQIPAGYNQQVTTQASGGAIGAGVVAILLLGTIVFFRVKNRHMKVGDAVVVTLLGIAISGTVIGGMGDQITESAVASLSNVLGGL